MWLEDIKQVGQNVYLFIQNRIYSPSAVICWRRICGKPKGKESIPPALQCSYIESLQAARAAAITHTSKHTIPDKSTFPSMWTHRKPEAGRAAGRVISVISVTGLYTHEVYSGHWLSKPIRFGAQPSIPQILLNFSYMHFLQTIMRTLNIVLVKCNFCSGQKQLWTPANMTSYLSKHLQRHSASRKLVARDLRTQSGSKWDFNYSFTHSVV